MTGVFEPGQVVVHRQFTAARLACVRTGLVVAHDERGLLLWIARHNPVLDWRSADGRGIRDMPFTDWVRQDIVLADTQWRGPDILMFIPSDAYHAVWFFFDDNGGFSRWYVNLEDPSVLWRDGDLAGVDGCDHDLDLVAYPDGRWEWKDEDEFTERLALPEHYWVADEAAVRAEGARVLARFAAREFPFDGTWCDWRPDSRWTPPAVMPAGATQPRRS